MVKYTENYNLKKPEGFENFSVLPYNENMDILDAKIKSLETMPSEIQQQLTTHLDENDKNTCVLTLSGLQVIANEAPVRLAFEVVRTDGNNMATVGVEPRITIKKSGWYLVMLQSSFTFNPEGTRQLSFTVNDTNSYENLTTFSGTNEINTTGHLIKLVYLQENDYIQAFCLQNSGVSLNRFNSVLTVRMVA